MSPAVHDRTDAARNDSERPVRVWRMHGPHGGRLMLGDHPPDARRLRSSDLPGTTMLEHVRALDLPTGRVHEVARCPDCGRLGYTIPSGLEQDGREVRLCGRDGGQVAVRHAERVGRGDHGPRETCYVPVEAWDRDGGA